MGDVREVITDVLVVGSESAGGRAAIEAAAHGAKVILLTKGIIAKTGVTLKAVFSCNAAMGFTSEDNPYEHLKDTVIGGRLINDQRLATIFTEQAPHRLDELGKWGMHWDMDNGHYKLTKMYGHRFPRSLSVGFKVGVDMMRVMRQKIIHDPNITLMNEVFASSYLRGKDGSIAGCTAVHLKTGEFFVIRAKAIIDATGGPLRLWKLNSGTPESTGDGIAMAYRLGAPLVDMEYCQFHPLGLVSPEALKGDEGISSFVRGLGFKAVMYNCMGERFMARYDPKNMEWADRDVLAKAIFREVREGRGGPGGGIWLDISFLPDKLIEHRMSQVAPGWVIRGLNLLEYGIDLRKVPIEVGPTVHFFCGGLRVSESWETTIPGLFGAGEVAGGVHGANRIPGNALPECVVTGAITGEAAARRAREIALPALPADDVAREQERAFAPLHREEGVRPTVILDKLQNLMQQQCGVIRNHADMENARQEILRLRAEEMPRLAPLAKGLVYNREWIEVLELENMLEVAEVVVASAMRRTESRGNHTRDDYPETNNKDWLKNIVVTKSSEGPVLEPIRVADVKIPVEELM